jgi:hypothetical protein
MGENTGVENINKNTKLKVYYRNMRLLLGPCILHNPLIVGDGEAVTYRVRLKLDGKTIDETELKISFS